MNTTATEATGIEILYRNRNLHDVAFAHTVVDQYNSVADELELEYISSEMLSSKQFNIPQYYREIDVREYVLNLVPQTEDQADKLAYLNRVDEELTLFEARNLFPILQLMIYIVDTMRKHKIVWGVGRGSSVASYVLFLIGIHKIDSIKYELDIREFLK